MSVSNARNCVVPYKVQSFFLGIHSWIIHLQNEICLNWLRFLKSTVMENGYIFYLVPKKSIM